MSVKKPNFFIVGGSKCGTTNISYHLNEHQEVFVSELNHTIFVDLMYQKILKDHQ